MILIKKIFHTYIFLVLLLTFILGQSNQRGLFTDPRDGQMYNTIKFGEQVWFAQNLNYATEKGNWPAQGDSAGMQFGRFYNWAAAKEAIPAGWHLPSKQEFEILAATLGVADLPNQDDLYPLLIEGGISEFNVQLTGSHNQAYGRARGRTAEFWGSEEGWASRIIPFQENPWRLSVRAPNYVTISQAADSKFGFNVRCVKDN